MLVSCTFSLAKLEEQRWISFATNLSRPFLMSGAPILPSFRLCVFSLQCCCNFTSSTKQDERRGSWKNFYHFLKASSFFFSLYSSSASVNPTQQQCSVHHALCHSWGFSADIGLSCSLNFPCCVWTGFTAHTGNAVLLGRPTQAGLLLMFLHRVASNPSYPTDCCERKQMHDPNALSSCMMRLTGSCSASAASGP